MDDGDCDAAIAEAAAAAVTHVQSQSQEVGSGDEGLGLLCFDWEKMSKRLGGIKGCQYKTSSWHLNGFPDANNIGSTV